MKPGLLPIDDNQFAELLRQAQQGNEAAREKLFTLSREYLSQCAEKEVSSWLRPKHDASDLVQVSLLEAHRAFVQFEGTDVGQWLAFLKRILERNATDVVRHYGTAKRQAGKEIALHAPANNASSSGEQQLAAPGETPSLEVTRKESADRLLKAMEQLSPDHQEVIRLRNLDQLPFDEVAERMKRTRPAVQMLWMRAIKSLEAIMQQDAPSTMRG